MRNKRFNDCICVRVYIYNIYVPLKTLPIGRHPSLPQRSPSTDRSESGLNPYKAHYLMPLLMFFRNDTVTNSSATSLPNHGDRSRFSVFTFVAQALPRDRNEAEDEPGDSDQETEDEGRWSAGVGGRSVASVEQFGRWRHNRAVVDSGGI